MNNKEFKSDSDVKSKGRAPATILSLSATLIFLLLFSACQKPQEKKSLNIKKEAKSKTICPYCGEYATQLYICTNSNCSNSDPERGVGCTNPDIDYEGNPKCLYKYVYGAYCRRCNKKARIFAYTTGELEAMAKNIQAKSEGTVGWQEWALVYKGSLEKCYHIECVWMSNNYNNPSIGVFVDGNYTAALRLYQSTDVCGKSIWVRGVESETGIKASWKADAIN